MFYDSYAVFLNPIFGSPQESTREALAKQDLVPVISYLNVGSDYKWVL